MTASTILRKGMEANLSNRTLFDDECSLTYRELLAKADQIAAALQEKGAAEGDLAAIVLPRSMDYVAAEAACVLYGYGAVLLDAAYPKDRVEYCIENSGAKFVIDAGFLREAQSCSTAPVKGDVRGDTPAIVIYTSGSTRKPKGVLHDQESIAGMIDRLTDFTSPLSTDVYEKRLKGLKYDTLIETYLEQIMRIVPDPKRIIGFMGFSFGGEVAASLACRFREVEGRECFAILGDTVVKAPGEYLDRKLTKEDIPEDVTLGMKEKIDSFVYRADIINSFGYGKKYACYDGPVTLIDSKLGYTEEREEKKLVNAAVRYSNLTVIPMEECTHSDLFRNMDLLPFYQSLIDACYKEKGGEKDV